MHHRSLVLGILAATVVLLALGLAACGGSETSGATALKGTTLQGDTVDLALAGDKPTVVNFFASWCPPCNSEAGDLVKFAKAHPEVQIVGVAVNDAKADAEGFVSQYGLPYTVLMDPDGEIAGTWGVDGIPATFFLDKDGKQQASMVGAASLEQFEEKLKSVQ